MGFFFILSLILGTTTAITFNVFLFYYTVNYTSSSKLNVLGVKDDEYTTAATAMADNTSG